MNTLVTGDLHLSEQERDRYRFLFLEQRLPKLLDKQRCGCLLLLGDLTEEKDRHTAALVNRIADGLARLRQQVQVIWLLGNHDYVDRQEPFFRAVATLAGVEAVTTPTSLRTLPSVKSGGWGPVWLLPHTRDWQRDWADVTFSRGTTYFTHQTFKGARAEHGRELDGIPTSIFPKGSRCFSGDVHVPQDVGPVTYVGAPYSVDFGDRFKPRVIVLGDDGTAKSVGVRGPGKVLLEVNSPDDLDAGALFDGDMVKVRVRLPSEDYDQWPVIRKQVLEWASKNGVQVHTVLPDIDPARFSQRIREPVRSDADLLEEYAKHYDIDRHTLRTGRLLMEGGE